MDADNRVILNCGGIRHEVYKVIRLLMSSLEIAYSLRKMSQNSVLH